MAPRKAKKGKAAAAVAPGRSHAPGTFYVDERTEFYTGGRVEPSKGGVTGLLGLPLPKGRFHRPLREGRHEAKRAAKRVPAPTYGAVMPTKASAEAYMTPPKVGNPHRRAWLEMFTMKKDASGKLYRAPRTRPYRPRGPPSGAPRKPRRKLTPEEKAAYKARRERRAAMSDVEKRAEKNARARARRAEVRALLATLRT